MPARRKPISLSEHDDGVLRVIYYRKGIPRDQYKKRPKDLRELADEFNRLTGREDEPEELVRYMQNQQKAKPRLIRQGREPWPTFDGEHKKAPALSGLLDEEKLAALWDSYEVAVVPHGIGDDAAYWNDEIVAALAAEFTRRTAMIMSGAILLAIVEERRKRGLWFKVGRKSQKSLGFADLDRLDEAAGQDD